MMERHTQMCCIRDPQCCARDPWYEDSHKGLGIHDGMIYTQKNICGERQFHWGLNSRTSPFQPKKINVWAF